jgi:hypothetical protein
VLASVFGKRTVKMTIYDRVVQSWNEYHKAKLFLLKDDEGIPCGFARCSDFHAWVWSKESRKFIDAEMVGGGMEE